jgi:hypothetical protein
MAAAKKKSTAKRPVKRAPRKPKPKPKAKPKAPLTRPRTRTRSTPPPRLRTRGVTLGEISVPSGDLAIFDIGLAGYLARPALEPAIVRARVPADRALPVVATAVGKGRFADCWDHVAVVLDRDHVGVHTSKKIGTAAVDCARLVCMDHAALDHWVHEDSLDGRADVVFWGRDAEQLARHMSAPRTTDGHGWVDLLVPDAEARHAEALRRKSANSWLLAMDYRPHSHHFHALAAARKSPWGAGTLDLAGTRLVLFFTSWGDGVFPVFLDLDEADRPVQIRIQLASNPEGPGA